jgi:acetylornithine deacetylase/succinyl-diaminopimelate desuccinylase-like protein
MLNGHLDTVPLGDEALWPHPPLAGAIAQARLWGRGACDMKSALACMAFAAKDAVDAGVRGTLLVTAVVQEEVGGLGARYLGETMKADVAILGEPSKLKLMLGHRGRVEILASLPGKIAHAARAELGDNALYRAADLLQELRGLELPRGGPLGGSTLTPTRLKSYPEGGSNVVPGRAELTIDYRNIPSDSPQEIMARLGALAPEASLSVPDEHAQSENGKVRYSFSRVVTSYLAPGESAPVATARRVLKEVLDGEGLAFEEDCWWFGTDAPHLAATGAVVIGFGPGEEELAHTTRESVPLAHLPIARRAYAALVRAYLS